MSTGQRKQAEHLIRSLMITLSDDRIADQSRIEIARASANTFDQQLDFSAPQQKNGGPPLRASYLRLLRQMGSITPEESAELDDLHERYPYEPNQQPSPLAKALQAAITEWEAELKKRT